MLDLEGIREFIAVAKFGSFIFAEFSTLYPQLTLHLDFDSRPGDNFRLLDRADC